MGCCFALCRHSPRKPFQLDAGTCREIVEKGLVGSKAFSVAARWTKPTTKDSTPVRQHFRDESLICVHRAVGREAGRATAQRVFVHRPVERPEHDTRQRFG